jgi:hypothetical protein
MDIRIGDIVRFLSDKLEGKVTGILNTQTVQVYVDEYGFEIPASIHDLVVIHSDFTSSSKMQQTASSKPIEITSTNMVYLAIVPEHFNRLLESNFELFIVNDTDQTCLYSIAFRKEDAYAGIIAGNCQPDSSSSIGTYSLKEIDQQIKAVRIQAIFFQKGQTALRAPIDTEIKLLPANLCKTGAYSHSHWFNQISILRSLEKEEQISTIEIDTKQLKEALKEKKCDSVPQHRPQKQAIGNTIEIDLHGHEVLETTAGMESKDILEYQLEIFRNTMEEYKLRKGKKIIFIHGKGEGVLRQRIIWELQTKYKRHQHQDASFKQYGYGATMVTIK